MNIRFLETVVWLSELRNFRATAERMNITPAAISNRIAAIEGELGIKLFERDTREVHLTRDGLVFVEGARDIIHRYDALVSSVARTDAAKGTVRIGLLSSMALTILPGIIETLRKRFPLVSIAVTTDSSQTLLRRLDARELDVVLGFRGVDPSLYQTVDLCTLGMFWIANENFPDADRILSKSDLVAHPIISYEAGSHNYQRLIEYLPVDRLDESMVHYSNSLATTISLISAGIGISVLPPIVIQNELRSGSLKVLQVRPVFPSTDYFAVHLENPPSRLSPLIASIAGDVAAGFCALYDDALAFQNRD